MTDTTLFISAGEASGDRLGSLLMREIEEKAPDRFGSIRWFGMGGDKMHAVSPGLLNMQRAQSAGFIELLPKAPAIVSVFRELVRQTEKSKPSLAILVDFPDFNLRLAKALHRQGIPTMAYVAPQLWAWRETRVKSLRRHIDLLAVLFPFEEKWFGKRGVNAAYAGHPLIASAITEGAKKIPSSPTIGLFPGSRSHEISAILPTQLAAAQLLMKHPDPFVFQVHAAPNRRSQIEAIIKQSGIRLPIVDGLNSCDFAWCAAGTTTFQLALARIPFILTHSVQALNYQIAKRFIRTPWLAMPSILLNRQIAPELIQENFSASTLVRETRKWLADDSRLNHYQADCHALIEQMRIAPTRGTAADLALQML